MAFLTIIVALVGILLMGSILIQNPKGGGVDSTFGGGAANQMFGASKSSDFIEKATWGLAILMLALCVLTTMLI
jgi:preprotein translocase subunit SecG